MSKMTEAEAQHQLQTLRQEFEHWRQTRSRPSERIPEPLWAKAVALSHVLLNSRVAKALNLSPSALKARRLGKPVRATQAAKAPVTAPVQFIELPRHTATAVVNDATEVLSVELERADGSRLRLRCGQASTLDALVQRFLA